MLVNFEMKTYDEPVSKKILPWHSQTLPHSHGIVGLVMEKTNE
jgi:hypothetical protein